MLKRKILPNLKKIGLILCSLVSVHDTCAQVPNISSFTPASGFPLTTVTINGSNFGGTTATNVVYFGATKGNIISATSTEIQVTTDTGATLGPINILNTLSGLQVRSDKPYVPTFFNEYFIQNTFNYKRRVDFAAGSKTYVAAIGDVDGDGKADLIANNRDDDNVYVYRNVSSPGSINTSSFAAPIPIITGPKPTNVKLSDIDGDGKLDIITANNGNRTVSVLRNLSDASGINFDAHVDYYMPLAFAGSKVVAIADLDNDGKLDIAVTASDSNGLVVFKNTATVGVIDATSFAAPISMYTGIYPIGVIAEDLNNDGKIDLATVDSQSRKMSIFRNVGMPGVIDASTFAARDSISTGVTPVDLVGVDLDGDGLKDVVVTNSWGQNISIYRNISTSTSINFAARVDKPAGAGPTSIAAADMDGDGKADLAISNAQASSSAIGYGVGLGSVVLMHNSSTSPGSIVLDSIAEYASGIYTFGVNVGDLDGDRYPDIVLGNNGTSTGLGSVSILRGYPLPEVGPISGPTHMCYDGATITLTDTSTTGYWQLANTTIATITSSGVVTSFAPGIDTVFYIRVAGGDTNMAVHVFTIDPIASVTPIAGGNSVCVGTDITLTSTPDGGSWSSASPLIATVNTAGVATGLGVGAAIITYYYTNACGSAFDTALVNVVTYPSLPIGTVTGPTSVCVAGSITLNTSIAGGVWLTSNASLATVAASSSSTASVTGVAVGTPTITYRLTNACGTASRPYPISVVVLPDSATLSGDTVVCVSATTMFTAGVGGGTWSSSNDTIATVATDGTVYGVSEGFVTISYALSNICGVTYSRKVLQVKDVPSLSVISGEVGVCIIPDTATLTSLYADGVWSSSSSGVATIDPTGLVTSVGYGTATISYARTNTCGTTYATYAFHVDNTPPDITSLSGGANLCPGGSTTWVAVPSYGSWSSADLSIGTVSASGLVHAVTAGSTTISYHLVNGCGSADTTALLTVIPVPNAGTISGVSSLCVGNSTTLTSTVSGGVWSSGTTTIATIDAGGIVHAATAGVATISYAFTNTCGTAYDTFLINIYPLPNAGTISGAVAACQGVTTTYTSSGMSGGVWSVSTPSLATISSSGVLSPISSGGVMISYEVTNSCGANSDTLLVNITDTPVVGVITGISTACVGATVSLSGVSSGGVWSSTAPSIASVSSSGVVFANGSGLATISYSVTNSCGSAYDTIVFTVNAVPDAGVVSGPAIVCAGTSASYSTSVAAAGAWSCSPTALATISSLGSLTALGEGTVVVTYSVTNTCGSDSDTLHVNILAVPVAGNITGPMSACEGATVTLSGVSGVGSWSSTSTGVATFASPAELHALAAGTTTISYVLTNACGSSYDTAVFTVLGLPNIGTISGSSSICLSSSATLGDVLGIGSWSSSAPSVITVNSSGIVTALTMGSAIISYSATNTCGTSVDTIMISVSTVPALPILSGADSLCVGATNLFSASISGGAWSILPTSIATITTSGLVGGASSGTAVVSYVLTNTCGNTLATKPILINPLPIAGVISGGLTICPTATTTLSSSVSGGVWSSAGSTVATISVAGVVYGVSPGVKTVTYTYTNYCGSDISLANVTVLAPPNAGVVSGSSSFCVGNTSLMSTTGSSGGVWSISNPAIATITSVGNVTALAQGNAIVSYTVTNPCGTAVDTMMINVSPLPNAGVISGASAICQSTNATLSVSATGGVWTSSNTAVVTITGGGIVWGSMPGSTTINYTVTNTCGTAVSSHILTVNALPNAGIINGSHELCLGATQTLLTTGESGVWTSITAHVNSLGSGVVVGTSLGGDTVYNTVTNGCGSDVASFYITVTPLPNAGIISGVAAMCEDNTTTFSSTVSGGVWSTSNTTVATISNAGLLNAISAGSILVSYSYTNSCGTAVDTANLTVHAMPYFTGATDFSICDNLPFIYAPATVLAATYTWERNPVSGVVNAYASDTGAINELLINNTALPVTVMYTYTAVAVGGCSVVQPLEVIVNPAPRLSSSLYDTICSGSEFEYIATSATPGVAFNWVRNAVLGISPNTSFGGQYVTDTLVNSATSHINVPYLFVLNAGGCSDTEVVTLTVNPQPAHLFITTFPGTSRCGGEMYWNNGLSDTPRMGAISQWTTNEHASIFAVGSTQQYCLVNLVPHGNAVVTFSSYYPGYAQCTDYATKSMNVSANTVYPHDVIKFANTLECLDNTVDYYQWGYDDVETLDSTILVGETNQFLMRSDFDFVHKYYWVLTGKSDCQRKSYYHVPVGIAQEQSQEGYINIWPNPSSGSFTLRIPELDAVEATIVVVDVLGKEVSRLGAKANADITVDMQQPSGIYTVIVTTSKGVYKGKVVVQ